MKRSIFPAMGTSVDVTAASEGAIDDTRQAFESIEDCCSRFRPESELSRMNDDPNRVVPVSALMAGVLQAADHVRSITRGLVDAGLGHAVRAWGYDRSFERVEDRLDGAEPTDLPESEWAIRDGSLVRSPGTTIDLGGIAKGWTCDLAVDNGLATIVSAGGDVRSAAGSARVEIVDPWGDVAATVPLGIGALATSSVSRRRWRLGSSVANHLIDPRTMRPSDGPVLQATAITATAVEAEAAAKAIVLLGVDGLAWADRQPWIRGALAVWRSGCVYGTTGLETAA
jgi:thiamine biosynthesis lipoprotein